MRTRIKKTKVFENGKKVAYYTPQYKSLIPFAWSDIPNMNVDMSKKTNRDEYTTRRNNKADCENDVALYKERCSNWYKLKRK